MNTDQINEDANLVGTYECGGWWVGPKGTTHRVERCGHTDAAQLIEGGGGEACPTDGEMHPYGVMHRKGYARITTCDVRKLHDGFLEGTVFLTFHGSEPLSPECLRAAAACIDALFDRGDIRCVVDCDEGYGREMASSGKQAAAMVRKIQAKAAEMAARREQIDATIAEPMSPAASPEGARA